MRVGFSCPKKVMRSYSVVASLLVIGSCSFTDLASDAAIRSTVAMGLRRDWNTTLVPDGAIEVMPEWAAGGGNDLAKRRFTPKFVERLRAMESAGFLSLAPMTDETLMVSPSDSLRQMADTTVSKAGYLWVPTSDVEITSIVSDSAYSSPNLSPSERFRLVFGEYTIQPNRLSLALGGEGGSYQFKALLKYDPFTKNYVYVTADYRRPGQEEWATDNVK